VFTGHKIIQRLFQVTAWLLALAIVVLSLGPPSTRPVTGAGHNLEHLLIFLATGLAFGLGYPRRFWLLPIALLAFTAAIEIAQIYVSGRHARLSDFLVDVAALYVGLGLSYLLVKLTAATIES
jgi:VanZ family protein